MKQLINQVELRAILQRGIDAGRWTLEDLDRPSPGWKLTQAGIKAWAFGHHYRPPKYTNPLRDQPAQTEDESYQF